MPPSTISTETIHQRFSVPLEGKPNPIQCIKSFPLSTDPPPVRPPPRVPTLIFTHGASGTLDTPGILNFRTGFAKYAHIICFQGNSNLASRTKMFNAVIDADESKTILALGGRSMGARAAVAAAGNRGSMNLVLVSYPLHTEKGDVRDEVLMEMDSENRVLFVIGHQDEMCGLERLEEVRGKMAAKSWLIVVERADHGMNVKPKKGTGPVGELTGKVVYEWLKSLEEKSLDESLMEGRIWWDKEEEVGKWSGWEKQRPVQKVPKANEKAAKKGTGKTKEPVKKAVKSKKEPKTEDTVESTPGQKAEKPSKKAVNANRKSKAEEGVKSKSDESAQKTTRPKRKAPQENIAEDEGEQPKDATKSGKRTQSKTVVEDLPKKPARKRRKA